MLINCPECKKSISDKAVACPNCGYPINQVPVHRRASQNRYKKLPNGFGSIKRLSGNRRRPYACFPPTQGWTDEGKAIIPKAIGYFATYNEAYVALAQYNSSPYDTDMRKATFKDVCELLFAEKFKEGNKFSESTKVNYRISFNLCKPLHNKVFSSIKKEDLQKVMDEMDKSYSTLSGVKNLFTQVYKYAISYDMIPNKNIGSLVKINKENDVETGIPFSAEDIELLWSDAPNSLITRITLIMIYSGLRIKELIEVSEIDLEKGAFKGGVKTTRGKERIVPFNHRIEEFIPELIEYREKHQAQSFRKSFEDNLKALGLLYFDEDKKHTPHDCRHTFSWLADKYEVNEFSKHLLMGHSLGNDVEKSVYGHRTFEQLKIEINKIV